MKTALKTLRIGGGAGYSGDRIEPALELAEQLAPGQAVYVLTPFHPLPLLDVLAVRGYDVRASALVDGGTRVEIGCTLAHDPTRD